MSYAENQSIRIADEDYAQLKKLSKVEMRKYVKIIHLALTKYAKGKKLD